MDLTIQEYHDLTRKLTKTVPPPPGITSWMKPVDAVVIPDSKRNLWPLLKAAETALGEQFRAKEYCGRSNAALTAAIGAPQRALEWVGY